MGERLGMRVTVDGCEPGELLVLDLVEGTLERHRAGLFAGSVQAVPCGQRPIPGEARAACCAVKVGFLLDGGAEGDLVRQLHSVLLILPARTSVLRSRTVQILLVHVSTRPRTLWVTRVHLPHPAHAYKSLPTVARGYPSVKSQTRIIAHHRPIRPSHPMVTAALSLQDQHPLAYPTPPPARQPVAPLP